MLIFTDIICNLRTAQSVYFNYLKINSLRTGLIIKIVMNRGENSEKNSFSQSIFNDC